MEQSRFEKYIIQVYEKCEEWASMKQENGSENNVVEVGRRLKDIRRALGISQKDFAARIDVTGSLLSEIEAGKVKAGYHFLIAIAREFRVNPTWVLLEEGEMFLSKDGLSAGAVNGNEFGDQTVRVKELLWYLKHSPLVQSTVLGFVGKFLLENEQSIRKDIEKSETRKVEKVENNK
jgi:transcriptional regulator with XRE-family HTH domain